MNVFVEAIRQQGLDVLHRRRRRDRKTQPRLALEDSANGVRSAVAAGIPTLVTVSDYTKGEDFSGAAVVVDQLGEPDALLTVIIPAPAGEPLQWIDVPALRRIHRAAQQHAAVRQAMGQNT